MCVCVGGGGGGVGGGGMCMYEEVCRWVGLHKYRMLHNTMLCMFAHSAAYAAAVLFRLSYENKPGHATVRNCVIQLS